MAVVGFSISRRRTSRLFTFINRLAATSLDLIGASSYVWHWKHAIFHHTYCNVHGFDTDIDVSGLARFSPHAKLRRIHRWQHIYLWMLYGVMASRWHLYDDFHDVIVGSIGPHRFPRPKGWDLAIFILGKATSFSLLLVIPCSTIVVARADFHVAKRPDWVRSGIVFQLMCRRSGSDPRGRTVHRESGAVHQVETWSIRAAHFTLCWLLGGLNFQIEHAVPMS